MVDWSNPQSQVSQFFKVRECLWLPTWSRMATDADGLTDEIRSSLFALCQTMDHIREFFEEPINVHCTYRPPPYSVLVGGSATDVHTKGMAMDFDVQNVSCDDARSLLFPSLDALQIRMEKNPGKDWLHVDIHPVGPSGRYFNP